MEIYPEQQFLLFFASFTAGILLGGFYEVLRALRILFGAASVPVRLYPLYDRKLPLIKKSVPLRESKAKKVRRVILVAIEDFLFMVVAAVTAEFLLYDHNCGEFRLSALLLILLGFALWRVSVARLCGLFTPYLAYGISALWLYLKTVCLLPFRGLRALGALCARPIGRLWRRMRQKIMRRRSLLLCEKQLKMAACGLGYEQMRGIEDGKEETPTGRKTAPRHSAVDHSDLPGHSGDRGKSDHGGSAKRTAGGRHGKAPGTAKRRSDTIA